MKNYPPKVFTVPKKHQKETSNFKNSRFKIIQQWWQTLREPQVNKKLSTFLNTNVVTAFARKMSFSNLEEASPVKSKVIIKKKTMNKVHGVVTIRNYSTQ